jgi:hypothetical protein
MENAAAVARRLLTAALEKRRASVAVMRLASIFFANSGAIAGIDDWEEKWQQTLRKEADALPAVQVLRFLGIEQARQEQKLALTGITKADPSAWQNSADAYLWGSYREVPTQKTTPLEETEVEAEIFLWRGQDDPERFSRRFAVKDFPDASRALAQEVLRATAQRKRSRSSPEAGAKVGDAIFARLCTLVGGGFFTSAPPWRAFCRLRPWDSTTAHLLFQTSSDAVQLLDTLDSGRVLGETARLLYRKGEAVGWTDLLSSDHGVFSPAEGLPVAIPSTLGFDGAGRAVVADDKTKTVALFDWSKRQWLTLPAPPTGPSKQPPPSDGAPKPGQPPATAKAFGSGSAIVFPHWNLAFDQTAQKWRDLPTDACLPSAPPSAKGSPFTDGDMFCVDDHLWSWNQRGITDFSMGENRVVWHSDDCPPMRRT